MPRGSYLLTPGAHEQGSARPGAGPAEVREVFACAAGPAGWRYTAERTDGVTVDLTCDAVGRVRRLTLAGPAGELRGGVLGSRLLWAGPDGREHDTAAVGFAGGSPGGWLALARLLSPELGIPGDRPLVTSVVSVTMPGLAALTVRQAWALAGLEVHDTDTGPLPVSTYTVDDLDTGDRVTLHVAGDVLLAADGPAGSVALLDLDGPPGLR